MKIQRDAIIVSEDGTEIRNPKDGFIVMGNIMVAEVDEEDSPIGGIIGNNFDDNGQVKRYVAFTREELLKVLNYTIEDLELFLTKWRKEKAHNEV